MILGSSKDPVQIKKIYLRIWTLRDEVEAVLKARVESGKPDNISVDDLIEEYRSKSLVSSDGSVTLAVLNGGKEDGDAEEASAPEDSEAKDDETEKPDSEKEEVKADSEDSVDTEKTEDAEAKATTPEEEPSVEVIQRRPSIPDDKLYKGTTVLTELNMEEMYFFSNQTFLEGQSIVLEFMIPNRFVVNANVFYSRPYNYKSRIIRDNNLIYRVAVRFSFLKPGERTLLRQFVKSVEPDQNRAAKPKTAAKSKSDGFDDLDDLDL